MADYIYTMETRLTPEQYRGVGLVSDIARAHAMNVYLTGGAIRDMLTGLAIRDLDFTVQGNPLKLQKDLEKAGVVVQRADEDLRALSIVLPGNNRGEINMARAETYEKPGRPKIEPATIVDDLRRRDFTFNAMALSLNPGSRGLLLDPANGAADVEAKLIRILHNYAFLDEPSRLIRAIRFQHRFHFQIEERTQARYDAAKENKYIEYISDRAIGYEIEQIAYEEDALHILKAYEREGWLEVLHPRWTTAKADTASLSQLGKLRQQMQDFGYAPDVAPATMYFLTARMSDKDVADVQKLIPNKALVAAWRSLEDRAKELGKQLSSKEAATPSGAWDMLSKAAPETILFLELTGKNQAAGQKIKNFFGKWRQLKDKLPLPEMAELFITPSLPEYPQIAEKAFRLMLDGKLRSRTEILKFLKPLAPPPPPPPPPPPAKRGRAAKAAAEAAAATAPVAAANASAKGKKGKAVAATPTPAVTPPAERVVEKVAKAAEKSAAKSTPPKNAEVKPAKKAAPVKKAPPKKAANRAKKKK